MKKPDVKMISSEEFIVTLVFLLSMIGLAVYASGWAYKPKLVPMGISVLATLLLLGRIVIIVRKKEGGIGKIPWQVMAGFFAFGVAIPIAWIMGMVLASGLLGASLSFIFGERRWWVIPLVGIAAALMIYFIFGIAFGVPMTF